MQARHPLTPQKKSSLFAGDSSRTIQTLVDDFYESVVTLVTVSLSFFALLACFTPEFITGSASRFFLTFLIELSPFIDPFVA